MPSATPAPLDPGGPTSTTDGRRQSVAQWLVGLINQAHGVSENITDALKNPFASGPDALSAALQMRVACGEVPTDAVAVSKCIDKLLGRTTSSPAAEVTTDLPSADGANATLTKVAGDTASIELQQQIAGKSAAGIVSSITGEGPTPQITEQPPRAVPAVLLQPSGVVENGHSIPLIERCAVTTDCVIPSSARCGPSVTAIACVLRNGETVSVDPNGTAKVVFGEPTSGAVAITDGPLVGPDGSHLVTTDEGWTIRDPGPDGSNSAARSSFISRVGGPVLKVVDIGGRVLGWAGFGLGIFNVAVDIGHSDYPAALHAGADTAWGALLLFGGSSAIADTIGTVALALAPAAPAVVVVAVAFVAIVLVSWAVSVIIEALFNNLFAPDIYVDNSTGRDQRVAVQLATQGTHDVRPAWSGPAGSWSGTAHSDGTLTVGGIATGQLHYQLLGPAPFQRLAGWQVPRAGFADWARATLPRYGFDAQAVSGFVSAWSELGAGDGAIDIYPQTGALLDRLEPLTATSSAGVPSVRRVWFVVAPAGAQPPAAPVVIDGAHAPIDIEEWGMFLDRGADPVGGLRS